MCVENRLKCVIKNVAAAGGKGLRDLTDLRHSFIIHLVQRVQSSRCLRKLERLNFYR